MASHGKSPDPAEAYEGFLKRTDSAAQAVLNDPGAMDDIRRSLRQEEEGRPFTALEVVVARRKQRAHRTG
jgi:hypothetical protein